MNAKNISINERLERVAHFAGILESDLKRLKEEALLLKRKEKKDKRELTYLCKYHMDALSQSGYYLSEELKFFYLDFCRKEMINNDENTEREGSR